MASSDIAGGGPPPPPKTSFWDKLAAKAKEVGEQTKEKAIDLKLAADDQLEKARQSDAWQKTKEGAGQAWDKTKVAAMQAHSQVKTAIQGEKNVVTFTETKLGMTLARDDRSVSFHAKHTKNKVSIFKLNLIILIFSLNVFIIWLIENIKKKIINNFVKITKFTSKELPSQNSKIR